ncbi:MAG TPA: RdgB/HAM1 family non-canonical purine NTP pyrophosphatase [Actinomycetota bacterium]|nr:RdgB/HAM1 family non-canonical purine NTP pyrophosphatase [Actinomycetota bacterium]
MTRRVALATKNAGKVREIGAIVAPAGIELVSPDATWVAPEETEPDYRGNALLKARSLVEHMQIACLADDSGIEVDLLDGGPGPRSARFAGEHATDEENLNKLIAVIARAPEDQRAARYRCVAVLVTPEGDETVCEGSVEGALIVEPRGTGGFGYDPIFIARGETRTMAELTPEEKDAISHRGAAFRAILPALRALGKSG